MTEYSLPVKSVEAIVPKARVLREGLNRAVQ